MKSKLYLIGLFAALNIACEKDKNDLDDPNTENDEELITTVQLTFQDSAKLEQPFVVAFQDIDGLGGDEPTQFDTIRLDLNTVYDVSIRFLNESESPAEDITEEVEEEADEHLVCYSPNEGKISVVATDTDGNHPIGLTTKWRVKAQLDQEVTVSLKHQPDGLKNGSCNVGETDVEITFPIKQK